MIGGLGDDIYFIDSLADVVQEDVGAGSDELRTPFSTTLPEAFEDLKLTGSSSVDGTGNASANRIDGNNAANHLSGLAENDKLDADDGNDTVDGGAGMDRLTGGKGADRFRFTSALSTLAGIATNTDTIIDFKPSTENDRLQLSTSVFTALTGSAVAAGQLTASAFLASNTGLATNGNQRILFNTNTRLISYDSDGNGAAAAYPFAKLNGNSPLSHSDIQVGSYN